MVLEYFVKSRKLNNFKTGEVETKYFPKLLKKSPATVESLSRKIEIGSTFFNGLDASCSDLDTNANDLDDNNIKGERKKIYTPKISSAGKVSMKSLARQVAVESTVSDNEARRFIEGLVMDGSSRAVGRRTASETE